MMLAGDEGSCADLSLPQAQHVMLASHASQPILVVKDLDKLLQMSLASSKLHN